MVAGLLYFKDMNTNRRHRAATYAATIAARLAARATAHRVERAAEAARVERVTVAAAERAAGVAYRGTLDAHRAAAGVRRVRAGLGLDMPARRPVVR